MQEDLNRQPLGLSEPARVGVTARGKRLELPEQTGGSFKQHEEFKIRHRLPQAAQALRKHLASARSHAGTVREAAGGDERGFKPYRVRESGVGRAWPAQATLIPSRGRFRRGSSRPSSDARAVPENAP